MNELARSGESSVIVLIYPYWNVNVNICKIGGFEWCVLIYPYWNVNTLIIVDCYFYRIVLIYPYWNVNVYALCANCPKAPRFNLSILECKFGYIGLLLSPSTRFNLSILECKYGGERGRPQRAPVLIYPYWNVNTKQRARASGARRRFNLSILECKFCSPAARHN